MPNLKKIIIAGLDNAGKTSILTAFDKRYNFETEINQIPPTRGVEYHRTKFFNTEINFWDMGGQLQYRKEYETHPQRFFGGTNLCIYVIDIQDKDTFEKSLEYLHYIHNFFQENEMNIPLIVALHKTDPEAREKPELVDNVDFLIEKLMVIENIQQFIQTSIYDILSIIELISTSITSIDPRVKNIKEYFGIKLPELGCDTLILFDENGVLISEEYSGNIDPQVYLNIIGTINDDIIKLKKLDVAEEEFASQVSKITDTLSHHLYQIDLKNASFYISAIVDTSHTDSFTKLFSKFTKRLKKHLKRELL